MDEQQLADDILENDNEVIFEDAVEPETTDDDQVEADNEQSEDEDEVVVTIEGEDSPPQEDKAAPEWVRDLRTTHRELKKRNQELEEKVKLLAGEPQVPQLGAKPTLESCDYDAEEFELKLENWHNNKLQVEEFNRQVQARENEARQQWDNVVEVYKKQKSELKAKDYDYCEDIVKDILSVTQQNIILGGSDNPAKLVYALGKNPGKAKEFALIKDPAKFAFAVANLETKLKVTSRKTAPAPEKTIKGSGALSGSSDSQLERLREEAARTGDMSKVVAYKQKLKRK